MMTLPRVEDAILNWSSQKQRLNQALAQQLTQSYQAGQLDCDILKKGNNWFPDIINGQNTKPLKTFIKNTFCTDTRAGTAVRFRRDPNISSKHIASAVTQILKSAMSRQISRISKPRVHRVHRSSLHQVNHAKNAAVHLFVGNEMLVLKETRSRLWATPGGKRDRSDDDIWHTAVREFVEETGIALDPKVFTHKDAIETRTARYESVRLYRGHTAIFTVRLQRKPSVHLSREHSRYDWMTCNEIKRRARKFENYALKSMPAVC